MTNRKNFKDFSKYAKEGKLTKLCFRNYEQEIDLSIVKRICQRRVGKRVKYLDFELSNLKDDHFELVTFPSELKGINLNACTELGEKTMVRIADQCKKLEEI